MKAPLPAVVLAAGDATRFGSPKQFAKIGGETLVERTTRIVADAGYAPVFLVAGAYFDQMQLLFSGSAVLVIQNFEWEEGIASSIRCGIRAVQQNSPECQGLLLVACDQPAVTTMHLIALLSHADTPQAKSLPVASSYCGVSGIPAIFPSNLFPQLLDLSGDKGARQVLRTSELLPILVPLEAGEIDIDTPEDFARWMARTTKEENRR